jgi:predicted cobalt transporter CbtA
LDSSPTKGYHYIRYAVFGIYLLFLAKSFDWLLVDGFPRWVLSYLGMILTVLSVVMDVRNQILWRQEERQSRSDPGRPVVTWFLYGFYLVAFVWYLALNPNLPLYRKWHPSPAVEELALRQLYQTSRLDLEKARLSLMEEQRQLAAARLEVKATHDQLKQAMIAVEDDRRLYVLKLQALTREHQAIGKGLSEMKATLERLSRAPSQAATPGDSEESDHQENPREGSTIPSKRTPAKEVQQQSTAQSLPENSRHGTLLTKMRKNFGIAAVGFVLLLLGIIGMVAEFEKGTGKYSQSNHNGCAGCFIAVMGLAFVLASLLVNRS